MKKSPGCPTHRGRETSVCAETHFNNEAFQSDTTKQRKDSTEGCSDSSQVAVDRQKTNFLSDVLQVKISQ